MNWTAIEQAISLYNGQDFKVSKHHSIGGGCINETYLISGNSQSYFIKLNRASRLDMFEAEHEGLNAIYRTDTIRVPHAYLSGIDGENAYLVMEYIEWGTGRGCAEEMGRQLSNMHRHTQSGFGWHRNNTIGSTPQINVPTDDWLTFWREHRLGYQTRLAANKGLDRHAIKSCEQLCDRIGDFFPRQPQASLLHGDLWSGNAACDRQSRSVIFDPACYYGDRETDVAMTELFGGFDATFYASYQENWPLDDGYKIRKILYNQYHILNHFNLFGGNYGRQASRMAEQLLSECR